MRRTRGTGTIHERTDGRWHGAYTGRDGRRRYVYGRTAEDVEGKLASAMAGDRTVLAPLRPIYGASRRRPIIQRVLAEARAQEWDDEMLTEVLLAQLAARRVSARIVGPCVYCGSWVASEVEHRNPVARGGTNASANLTSSCSSCNSRKSDLTDVEYFALLHLERTGSLPEG